MDSSLLAAMAAVTAVTIFSVAFVIMKKRSNHAGYFRIKEWNFCRKEKWKNENVALKNVCYKSRGVNFLFLKWYRPTEREFHLKLQDLFSLYVL